MRALHWNIIAGMAVAIFILAALPAAPTHAEVACVNTIPVTDGTDDNLGFKVKLAGDSLYGSGNLPSYSTITCKLAS